MTLSLYARFQEQLIKMLRELLSKDPDTFQSVYEACKAPSAEFMDWKRYLESLGVTYANSPHQWHEHYKIHELILEQIEIKEDEPLILGLLGMKLSRQPIVHSPTEWVPGEGTWLRTDFCSHVGALEPGDVLASKETVLSPPREGGNGSVYLHLMDERFSSDLWFDYPSRTILALAGCLKPAE